MPTSLKNIIFSLSILALSITSVHAGLTNDYPPVSVENATYIPHAQKVSTDFSPLTKTKKKGVADTISEKAEEESAEIFAVKNFWQTHKKVIIGTAVATAVLTVGVMKMMERKKDNSAKHLLSTIGENGVSFIKEACACKETINKILINSAIAANSKREHIDDEFNRVCKSLENYVKPSDIIEKYCNPSN